MIPPREGGEGGWVTISPFINWGKNSNETGITFYRLNRTVFIYFSLLLLTNEKTTPRAFLGKLSLERPKMNADKSGVTEARGKRVNSNRAL